MEKRVGVGFLALGVTTDENANGTDCTWGKEEGSGGRVKKKRKLRKRRRQTGEKEKNRRGKKERGGRSQRG